MTDEGVGPYTTTGAFRSATVPFCTLYVMKIPADVIFWEVRLKTRVHVLLFVRAVVVVTVAVVTVAVVVVVGVVFVGAVVVVAVLVGAVALTGTTGTVGRAQ